MQNITLNFRQGSEAAVCATPQLKFKPETQAA
jgi:hypothetical protein